VSVFENFPLKRGLIPSVTEILKQLEIRENMRTVNDFCAMQQERCISSLNT
jgi:hypothetical protein